MRTALKQVRHRLRRILVGEPPPPAPRPFPQLVSLLNAFDGPSPPPRVLYLGDSVLLRRSDTDRNHKLLAELVTSRFRWRGKGITIARAGYHPLVHERFVRALESTKYRPRLIILHINERSFSPQWHLDPQWQFEDEIAFLESYATNRSQPIPATRPAEPTAEAIARYHSTEVVYPETLFQRIGQFRDLIQSSPVSEEEKGLRRRQILIFHYMHPLSPNHPMLHAVRELLRRVKEMGTSAYLYLTPVNHEAGLRLVGPAFPEIRGKNARTIAELVAPFERDGTVRFHDLGASLGSEYFFHRDFTTEHLNYDGRRSLADRVVSSANALPIGSEGAGR